MNIKPYYKHGNKVDKMLDFSKNESIIDGVD